MISKDDDMDFGELRHDVNFVSRVTDFDKCLEETQAKIKQALETEVATLTKEDQIKHELYLSYATNTLYYLYLKINGTNVNEVGAKTSYKGLPEGEENCQEGWKEQ